MFELRTVNVSRCLSEFYNNNDLEMIYVTRASQKIHTKYTLRLQNKTHHYIILIDWKNCFIPLHEKVECLPFLSIPSLR